MEQDSGKTAPRGEATHTPGPWEWDAGVVPPDGPGRYADIYVDGGETIIASFNDAIPEGRANARLIAAAPTLLAFHDAWVESQIANATGDPDLAKEKRQALTMRHKEVRHALAKASPNTAERGSSQ